MQTFLLIVIFILIVINLKQVDELRDLERKTLDDSQCRAAGGRFSGADEQEKTQSSAKRRVTSQDKSRPRLIVVFVCTHAKKLMWRI